MLWLSMAEVKKLEAPDKTASSWTASWEGQWGQKYSTNAIS